MDFYVVRGGHYAIGEIFNPAGIYGRWGRSGLTAYASGLLAMVPFMTLGFTPALCCFTGRRGYRFSGRPAGGRERVCRDVPEARS